MSSLNVVVRVSRDFAFPAAAAFDAWVDTERAKHFFFASPAGSLQRIELDPRVGGSFVVVDRRGEEDVVHTGIYRVVDRPRSLAFAFAIPAYSDESTAVTVSFEPLEEGARCRVTIDAGAVPVEIRARAEDGWGRMLERAEAALR